MNLLTYVLNLNLVELGVYQNIIIIIIILAEHEVNMITI